MDTPAGLRGISPGAPLRGALRPPGSKSIAQRALLAALLARGRTRIEGLPDGADVRAALALACSLGRSARRTADALELEGRPPATGGPAPAQALGVGESGTLARLATAALALGAPAGTRLRIEAAGTLLRRSSPPLFEALRAAGVQVDGSRWPVELVAAPPPRRVRLRDPVSSQEVSALLLALGAWPEERDLEVEGGIPSRPYVDLTLGVLARFGLRSAERPGAAGSRWSLRGPLRAPAAPLVVEPDASLAAVALAAGCLSGGAVRVPALGGGSAQGDVRIVEHLRAFGCEASAGPQELRAGGPPTRGARLDLRGEPDLAPVLAIVAAAAATRAPAGERTSELTGLETLPGKESSRIEVLARGLDACGWQVEAASDRLRISAPRDPTDAPRVLDPSGDHRMAFAFALLGLVRPALTVRDPACVSKSWPGFWDDLAALGAAVVGG